MSKYTRMQMIAMLALGGLLGYAAASRKLDLFRKAIARPVQQPAVEIDNGAAKSPASCCSEGSRRDQLVALAETGVGAAGGGAEKKDKKPNIVFIMGDDV